MWLLKIDGEPAITRFPTQPSPADGVFQCADRRWVFTASGFPRLGAGTLEVLGCQPDRDAVIQAVAKRESAELEESLTARGLTGVVVRTHDEWLEHPQGEAIRDVPAVVIERIADAPPTPLPAGGRPLSGLRVLDTTRVLAGPTVARTLAEFGADVLQVGVPHVPDLVFNQADTGHGKRRAFLDLTRPEDSGRMRQLLVHADVFSQSDRAGSMKRLGFGPDEVAALRPGIIYMSENCYGHVGPWEAKRGFDMNAQATCGIYGLHQAPGETLPRGGVAMAMNDYGTGYWGAYGVLRALLRRAQEGGSWHVKVSLSQTARWFMRLGTPYDKASGLADADLLALADRYREARDSAYGRLSRLKPIIQMSETPPSWELGTELPGSHQPVWAT